MTTEKLAGTAGGWGGPTVSMAQRRGNAGVCHCGQELDICSRTHCPRCGSSVTLRRPA
ncbi:hypothetical protein G7072_00625 [Nocardioides sp. HDW12B]|uniref:hypothetical protein n=1 Tax=Nocardioides sp. HDW12B TaxID=2714939 RepID=UPI001407B885|nr:hypothetical protein [Nocardioides sp. HDW12B]QIK65036.1 hypothetical protein G7072_00625 [Nocardioides sp. HDW12B]